MRLTDEQLVRSVREGVDARPGAGLPVEQAVRRGRRRVAVRRGVTGAAVAVVAAGAAVALSVTGLPLPSSAPPARAPSVTVTSTPATDLDDAARMRPALEDALAAVGLTSAPNGFTVSYSAAGDYPVGAGAGAVAGIATPSVSVFVSTAHVDAGIAVDLMGCDAIIFHRPDVLRCTSEPQPDGSLLIDLEYDVGVHELVLVHRTGWVVVNDQETDLDRQRELVLDPDLRW